jgi:hypothetical protein
MDSNASTPQSTQVTKYPPIPDPIDQIIAAVDRKYVPRELFDGVKEQDALLRSIEASVGRYRALVEIDRGPKDYKARVKRWTQVAKDTQRCVSSLRTIVGEVVDPWGLEHVIDELEHIAGPLCKSTLEDTEFDAEWRSFSEEEYQAGLPHGTLRDQCKQRPPIDWLVGVLLPRDFETHFKRESSTTPTGPCVSFIWRTLVEYDVMNNGKAYERTTISSTIRRVRNKRDRRGGKHAQPV